MACEESGVVTNQFRLKGHEAWSCDLEPTSGPLPEFHLQSDVLPLLERQWDMLIAFPPCTYLSNAGACRLYPKKGQLDPKRYALGLEGREFFLRFLNAEHIPMRCVENPVSSTVFDMPSHTQEIQPYMFGHPYTKKTRLWLRGLPPLQPSNLVEPMGPYVPSGTGRKDKGTYGSAKRGDDAKNRSKTFEGIAKAMADQWG